MRTEQKYLAIMEAAHKLEKMLSDNDPTELRYDEAVPMSIQVIFDKLPIPNADKVKFLHRLMGLYV